MSQDDVYLRAAVIEDMELLYKWRNDPICRKNSVCSEKILFETHCIWLLDRLKSSQCDIFICMKQNIPIGQVRIDYEDKLGKISYSIASGYRGSGYGTKMLSLLECEGKIQKNVQMLCAIVKKNNIASGKCFEKLGYISIDCGEFIYYSKRF